jgi:hypothetical protein
MLFTPRGAAAALLVFASLNVRAANAQVDYVDENGIRYQVTRQVVPRSVPVTKTVDQTQTTYRQQVTTENMQHQQVYQVPVTQYQIVSRLNGRWNPFVQPYWTHHYEPVTTWQTQVGTVQIPVTRVAWAPETRTVPQQVTTWETHNQEIVTKTPIGPSTIGGPGSNTALASRPLTSSSPSATISPLPAGSAQTQVASRPLGGEALTSDPPRQATGWQSPSTGASRY